MRYVSTRGQSAPVSFLDAVKQGLAGDGGLYVPEAPLGLLSGKFPHYADALAASLKSFAGKSLKQSVIDKLVQSSLDRLGQDGLPELQEGPCGYHLFTLYGGPSGAFKDYGLVLLADLLELIAEKSREKITVFCATSGDTGAAAVKALAGRKTVHLIVLYPEGRISPVQEEQITRHGASNITVFEVDGPFDACQAMVKAALQKRKGIATTVNSINIARLVAQVAVFLSLPEELADMPVVVPSGNFGNAYSAYKAQKMNGAGHGVVIATNSNDTLVRAMEDGAFSPKDVKPTISPAMDIAIPSNFERLLFDLEGQDFGKVRDLQFQLQKKQSYALSAEALGRYRKAFKSGVASEKETRSAIREWHEKTGNHIDPHTAVAFAVAKNLGLKRAVITATAHPGKFAEVVERETGNAVSLPLFMQGRGKRQVEKILPDVGAFVENVREVTV